MKNKSKHFARAIAIMLVIFFASCANEEVFENDAYTQSKIVSRYISFDEFKSSDRSAVLGLEEVQRKIEAAKNSKVLYNSRYNFYVDTEKILYLCKGDYKSYTFPIYREISNEKTENLVFTLKDNEIKAYIAGYTLTDDEREKIENREYVDVSQKTNFVKLENQTNEEPCWEIVSIPVSWNDQGQVTASLTFAMQVECPDSGGGGGDGDGDGDGEGGDSGSDSGSGPGWTGGGWWGGGWGDWTGPPDTGSGGGGGSGDGTDPGTNPEDPENTTDPLLSDWDGNTVVTAPVIDYKKHIKALNELTKNKSDGTSTIIKQKIDNLKSRLATEFTEYGYHFIKNGSNFVVREPNWWGANQVTYSEGDHAAIGTKVVMHMHQNQAQIVKGFNPITSLPNVYTFDVVPMFSDGDIFKTSEQFQDVDRDKDLTSILVSQEGTFALRIGNSNDVNNTFDILSTDEQAKTNFENDFQKQVLSPCEGGSNSCYVEHFSNFLSTYLINGHHIGLILFQAVYDSEGNIINWIIK